MEAIAKQFRDRYRAADLSTINDNTDQEQQFYRFLTLWTHSVDKGDKEMIKELQGQQLFKGPNRD